MCAAERSGRSAFPVIRWMIWGGLFTAGLIVWAMLLPGAGADQAWRAFLVNFIFFTPLAAGLVTWSAIVVASHGSWPGSYERLGLIGGGFAVPSIAFLIALWAGSPSWAPWYGRHFHQGLWLENTFLFSRDLAALVLFWVVARVYQARRRRGQGQILAGWLVFTYAMVFSLLGFDLVMALDPHWASSLFGAYFFISGLYIAVTSWALMAVFRPAEEREKVHDIGKLVFGFSILTTYMFFCQLLPIWYENLPPETRFPIPRMNFYPWKGISFFLVGIVYLGPLILLLTIRSKVSRWYLGMISVLVLAGLWIERWWLVAPVFEPFLHYGWTDAAATALFLGAAGLTFELSHLRMPEIRPARGEES